MPKDFDDYDYTREAILKQLGLIELHGKDGSAVDAGCGCIESKHTLMLEGLAEEMVGFSKTQAEKTFYLGVADYARSLRKAIDSESWNQRPHMTQCQQDTTKCLESHSMAECRKLVPCLRSS